VSPDSPEPGAHTPDEAELGPPVEELRDLSWALDAGFTDRVRGRIERRVLAGEFLDFAWTAPLMLLLELLRAPFEMFAGRRRP
jgi:hypothetical protein